MLSVVLQLPRAGPAASAVIGCDDTTRPSGSRNSTVSAASKTLAVPLTASGDPAATSALHAGDRMTIAGTSVVAWTVSVTAFSSLPSRGLRENARITASRGASGGGTAIVVSHV